MNTKLVGGLAAIVVVGGIAATLLLRHPAPPAAPVAPTAAAAPAAAAPPPAPPADCLLPGPPPVAPDGTTASAADMKLGHDVMQSFVNALEAYQACRNDQADHTPGVTDAQKDKWITQGNAAVDEANALANAFAVQLKRFKAREAAPANH